MDDEDRFSASSAESEREQEPDEPMEDVEEGDNEGDADEDHNDDDDDDEGNNNHEPSTEAPTNGADAPSKRKSITPPPASAFPWRPATRPEALNARLYDIVPTMAAPQSTSINAMAITPDLRYWMTGGSDGYIRKYDGPGTINGKLALTVAQKHPFVDSVTKAGILMSYWENDEPVVAGRTEQEHTLSPVYSLAVQSDALWLLSGLESGAINLQSVRHDEGKKICSLQKHTNAVSVLTLAQDEKTVLSGGWDNNIFDWDLNTGQTKRSFEGRGGQISAIEPRPASGDPIPVAIEEALTSDTMATNNGVPPRGENSMQGTHDDEPEGLRKPQDGDGKSGDASPAHESLFGGSDAGSLFGDTAGDQPFGQDDDEFGAGMEMMPGHEGGMDHSADMAMADMGMTESAEKETDKLSQSLKQEVSTPKAGENDVMEVDDATTSVKGSLAPAEDVQLQTRQSESEPLRQSQPDDQSMTLGSTDNAPLATGGGRVSNSPSGYATETAKSQYDPSQVSTTTFLSAAMDGTIRIWDRRAQNSVARIGTRPGVPPWCMSACWSPDGNMIYAGRRNGTVEEFDVRKASSNWNPKRALKFPGGSGAVSAVRPMVNGRHLVCASHDILRLYDLRDTSAFKHSSVPFLIIPGPPRAGVISSLYIDPTCRFMLSAAGTRGWEGTSTEVLIGYEINVSNG